MAAEWPTKGSLTHKIVEMSLRCFLQLLLLGNGIVHRAAILGRGSSLIAAGVRAALTRYDVAISNQPSTPKMPTMFKVEQIVTQHVSCIKISDG